MSKETFVGGDFIQNIGGSNKVYVKEGYLISGKEVIFNADKGIKHGEPGSPPKNDLIYDIVMFVAGTTDPVNTTGEKHQANTEYWHTIDVKTRKETETSANNFWNKIKDLKFQYLNLHIEGDFFSWSGDNNTVDRNHAAERLLDLFLRVYKNWKNQEVHLHLIGHSHGGNVINQFTELISKSDKYPKLWKVKSITYLSTPFFQKKHQLNHSKLHKDCKIINVHNAYDLTQQLVADFSLTNLEGLLKSFQMEKFQKGIQILKSVNIDSIKKNGFVIYMNDKQGALVWKEMAKAFLGMNMIISEFIKYVNSLKIENSNLQKEKKEFKILLNSLLQWTYDVNKNYTGIKYGKKMFLENLNLTQGLKVLNILFEIKSNPKDSYLLSLLAGVFGEQKGITDSIDETSWTPKKQTKGLTIKDVSIFTKDPYNTRNKKSQFDGFLKGAQSAVHTKNLEEMLMRLFSQFIKPDQLKDIIDIIDYVEYVIAGDLDKQLKILKKNFKIFKSLISLYHAGLVSVKDEKIKELSDRPGTIPYLAMKSHSLSHTQFWSGVEEGLRGAFSSGKNPGYKKK